MSEVIKPTLEELNRDALRYVLSSPKGRRFLWDLMGRCGFARNVFTGDNNATNFNAGRQSVATDLLVDIEAVDGNAFHLMAKESKEDQAYDNRKPNPSGGNAGSGQPAESGREPEYNPFASS